MAYGLKYYQDYCDLEGKSERIAILENGYEGLAQSIRAAPQPFQVSYESGSDFKFDPIRPSKATITLLYELDFQFSEIWTADERTFKIEKYHDNQLEWAGFVIPNGFRRLLIAGKKHIQVDAADGLSTLQSIPFLNTDGETYGTQDLVYNDGLWFPFSLIATEILRKLDLDINTWIAVDVYEQSMSKVGNREADPLSNAYVNVKTYINDKTQNKIPYWRDANAAWDCRRVLTNLLYIWGAKIYQEGGVWRIKRANLDANKTGKEWRIYNTLNVFIGKQPVEPDLNIPCNSIWDVLPGTDHVVNMDRVFDVVRINYTYSYERDAKESENFVPNPNFSDQGSHSPIDWTSWSAPGINKMTLQYLTLSGENTAGITTGLGIMGDADPRQELYPSDPMTVTAGDELHLEWWEKVDPYPYAANNIYTGVYRIYVEFETMVDVGRGRTEPGTSRYFLSNNGLYNGDWRGQRDGKALDSTWTLDTRDYFFSLPTLLVGDTIYAQNDFWVKIRVRVPSVPESGNLRFNIHGAGVMGIRGFDFNKRRPFAGVVPSEGGWERKELYYAPISTSRRNLLLTGFFFGVAKGKGGTGGGENEVLPADHHYIVYNNGEYTDRFEPIEIFNGDANDPNHVSRIRVLPADPVKQVWNTPEEIFYESSSLGLITAYSIMNQYNRPYKMLEGTFALRGLRFGSVVTLSSLPGEKFIVQRGTFNDYSRYGNFSGTLVQIAANQVIEDGYDNGNNTDPTWTRTGRIRCQKNNRAGVQTGYVEYEETNINTNSTATTRWVLSEEQDLVSCPLEEPSKYWFGADGVVLDTDDLTYFPVDEEGNEVTVTFANTGGLYLYFLHRVELGVVERIYTPVQSDIIRDWQYFDDVVIGGYTYRVLRMNHETGIFKNGIMTFVFNS